MDEKERRSIKPYKFSYIVDLLEVLIISRSDPDICGCLYLLAQEGSYS